jgi:hypothetical protein
MIGDDQKELFQDDNMPAMLVYWGDTFHNVPRYGRGQNVPPSLQAAAWAYGEKEQDFPIAADLASAIPIMVFGHVVYSWACKHLYLYARSRRTSGPL